MKRVLILEKNKITSEVLAESLTFLNYESFIYDYNERFSAVLERVQPHIVIICLGIYKKKQELYRLALKLGIDKWTFILTSNSILDPETVKDFGADVFLHKPYDLEALSMALNSNTEKGVSDLKSA